MLRFVATALGVAFLALRPGTPSIAAETRLYVTVFQSGILTELDANTGAAIKSIAVRDNAGIAAIAWSANGGNRRLFVLDGGSASRLRILDPASLTVQRELNFADRALRFSDYRLLYPSLDGRWLFVYTYRYRDAAQGIRVFNVENGVFEEAKLPDAGCPEPVLASARDGTIFVLCPGQATATNITAGGLAAAGSEHALPVAEVLAAAASPDGRDVYAVGIASPHDEWKLIRWNRIDGTTVARGVADVLATQDGSFSTSRQIALATTPDGRSLVLVHDSRAWIVDRDFGAPRGLDLPAAVRAVVLDPAGGSLLSLHAPENDDMFHLVRTGFSPGKPIDVTTKIRSGRAPVSLVAGVVENTR